MKLIRVKKGDASYQIRKGKDKKGYYFSIGEKKFYYNEFSEFSKRNAYEKAEDERRKLNHI